MDLKIGGPLTTILAAVADVIRARRENMDPEVQKKWDELLLKDYLWLRRKLGIKDDVEREGDQP